jgi:4-hydroxyphenylacetate 3-hydroxylase, reductase component
MRVTEATDDSNTDIDSDDFRRALGCFATGVSVVTSVDGDGVPMGMTVNSFNSVSLDPPLVLWSIAKDSTQFKKFMSATYFAVNILAEHQEDLSSRFAQRGIDRFAGLECQTGVGGVPRLPDYAACFECESEFRYEGGDHAIIVGRVLAFDDHATDPLIFYRGHYNVRREKR